MIATIRWMFQVIVSNRLRTDRRAMATPPKTWHSVISPLAKQSAHPPSQLCIAAYRLLQPKSPTGSGVRRAAQATGVRGAAVAPAGDGAFQPTGREAAAAGARGRQGGSGAAAGRAVSISAAVAAEAAGAGAALETGADG